MLAAPPTRKSERGRIPKVRNDDDIVATISLKDKKKPA